jgi:hypothetical protein
MVPVADEAQVEARFNPLGDSAKLDERWVLSLRRMYRFGRTRWNSLVT